MFWFQRYCLNWNGAGPRNFMKRFYLINYENIWKLKFFGLICSSNVSKVKYAWIAIKKYPQFKFWGNWVTDWDFSDVQKHQFLSIFMVFGPPWNPHLMPLSTPNFFCVDLLTTTQAYFTLETFEEHIRPKNFDFQIFS